MKGFTLIELIIVIVILGILASIALPKITENINKVRAAEAFNFASMVSRAFSRCLDDTVMPGATPTAADSVQCNDYNKLGIIDPATGVVAAPGITNINVGSFECPMAVYTAPDLWLHVQPILRVEFGGIFGVDFIGISNHVQTGVVDKYCGGKFAKMCKS